jgi:hypothetical protein
MRGSRSTSAAAQAAHKTPEQAGEQPPPRARARAHRLRRRFDGLSGSTADGMPRTEVPQEILDSIKANGVSAMCVMWCGRGVHQHVCVVGVVLVIARWCGAAAAVDAP